MVKSRKSTWRSGSGWWTDDPNPSVGGDRSAELDSGRTREVPATPAIPRPGKSSRRFPVRVTKMAPGRKVAVDVIKLQKLLVRARSLMSTQPVRAQEVCAEALQMSAASLKVKTDQGKTFREAFEQMARKARNHGRDRKKKRNRTKNQRGEG